MAAPQSVRDGSDTGQANTPDGCASGRHRLRPLGYVRGGGVAWLECDRPLHVVCRDCDYVTRWACSGHRESRCRPCAARYRRRVRKVAASGTSRTSGYQYFLTLTAPGVERHRMPSGDWCSCTPEGGVDLGRWNASHSARWNRLRTALRRLHPGLEFFRGVEPQQRGALHDHAMLWSPVPIRRPNVKALAMAAGFGHSIDLVECSPGSKRAAYYVSKYVTKATDQRASVPWWGDRIDFSTGEVTEGLVDEARYRTWSMSRQWGLTMAAVRAEAAAYAACKRRETEALNFAMLVGAFEGSVLVADESPPSNSA